MLGVVLLPHGVVMRNTWIKHEYLEECAALVQAQRGPDFGVN